MRMTIDSARINDPLLAQEIADFTRDCYARARARLFMERPRLNDDQMNDVAWIGSRYFLDNPDFYDRYRSSTPRHSWPYEANRDAGLAQVPSGGGYPSCQQWWADKDLGLRPRLLQQVEAPVLTRLARWAGFVSRSQVDDAVIRAIVAPRQQAMNLGQVYSDYGGQVEKSIDNMITRTAANVGLTVGSLGFFPAMDVVRQALPMVLSFLKMAMVICLPLVLVISTYDLKTLVTTSCVQFALFFVDFWFQLARWIDSTILDALYGSAASQNDFSVLFGLNDSFGDMLLNFVMGTMFLVLPAFWITALAWSGVRAGNLVQGLSDGTRESGNAAAKGASTSINAAKR